MTLIYDGTLVAFGGATGLSNVSRSYGPAANVGKVMGIAVSVGDFAATTEGPGFDHEIGMLDTEFLDEWSMRVVNVLTAPHEASVTLKGGAGYLLPGTDGLTGDVTVFPPDVCDPSGTLVLGNFGTPGDVGTSGSMIYNFQLGPDCTGVTSTTTNTTTTVDTTNATTTMPLTSIRKCGDPIGPAAGAGGMPGRPASISASDALFTLSGGVGSTFCDTCPANCMP